MDIPTELIDLARRIKEIQERTKIQEDDWGALKTSVDLAQVVIAGYERRLAQEQATPPTPVPRCPFLSSHLQTRDPESGGP